MSLLRNNLLQKALKVIPGESYQHLQYQGEAINSMGISVPIYSDAITVWFISIV